MTQWPRGLRHLFEFWSTGLGFESLTRRYFDEKNPLVKKIGFERNRSAKSPVFLSFLSPLE